jgi:hypothetical protein
VQDKITFLVDQGENFTVVDAAQWIDHIVIFHDSRSCRVEKFLQEVPPLSLPVSLRLHAPGATLPAGVWDKIRAFTFVNRVINDENVDAVFFGELAADMS